ncbi:MAG: hypothetical protein DME22_13905, partial [Verrucomicrobia bacterium]
MAALQLLVDAGADLNKQAGRWAMFAGYTPLGAAVSNASLVTLKELAELNKAAVAEGWAKPIDQQARREIALKMVELLIQAGADLNKLSPSRSPLNLAVHSGDYEVAQMLIKAGADPEGVCVSIASKLSHREGRKFVEGFFCTALHEAAQTGRLEICQALVSAGADINRLDHEGKTAVELAMKNHHADVAV